MIDHLPIDPPTDQRARQELAATMQELGKRPHVFIKVSNVLRRVNGLVRENADTYRPALDELWDIFGMDRLLYGSNWPVSNLVAPYATVLKVAQEYFAAKGREASEKYFWRNAAAVYRLT